MQFKKNRAILAAVVAAAMASTALMSVTASAAGTRTKAEKYGDETYAQRYLSLYDDVITNGQQNGYLSSKNVASGGFGIPYHAVEECICEAPDYGHETTSEAMSYIVWIAAMEDNITKNAGVSGVSASSDLAKAWKTLEAMIPSASVQNGFWSKSELSAQVAKEYPEGPENYPSEGNSGNVGKNPLHSYFTSAYSSRGGEYLLHWLADVDDWYGFGGSGRGELGTFTFINTFQRGDQESCFETIPHPSIETLQYGNPNQGMKFAFQASTAKSWSFTNAPDAEDRAIQAVYAANRWGVGNSSVSANAAEMGDECRNNMFDKYYKTIAANTTYDTDSSGGGLQGQHYLMSWYTGWGGAADGSWAWQIGCSHSHSFYQNPLAAYGLLYDSALSSGMKATDAKKDYTTSLQRQLEFYLWLQSAQGPFAGGATNSYNGRYEAYPSGISTFYEMAYLEHPVYADPGSNYWTGNQFWETQRLAELYYVVKTDGDASNGAIKAGGMSIEKTLETLLDKWVSFFVENTEIDANGDFQVPSNLSWSGQPATWTGTYSASANSGLTCSVTGYGNTDLGCANSLANTLIYYAKAKGVEASGVVEEGTKLEEKALYTAQQLMDRSWENGRDDIGLSRTEHNGSLARLFAQEVYVPSGSSGTYPYGYTVSSGATFSSIRPMYEDGPLNGGTDFYAQLKAAYETDVKNGAKWSNNYGASDAQGKAELESFTTVASVDLNYHRFWHVGDVLMALGTMYELYPDVTPSTVEPDTETDCGNADCSTGATYADRVTLADAVLMAKAVGGGSTLSTQGRLNADVEFDGTLNSTDLNKLLGYIGGKVAYSDFGKVTMS